MTKISELSNLLGNVNNISDIYNSLQARIKHNSIAAKLVIWSAHLLLSLVATYFAADNLTGFENNFFSLSKSILFFCVYIKI